VRWKSVSQINIFFSICKFVPLVVQVFKKQDYSLERFVPGTTAEH
jgi:maltodextrin utilization protein YvdJ